MMNDNASKAFWEKGFFRERMKLSEWRWWIGTFFLIFAAVYSIRGIYAGTFGKNLTPGLLSLIFIYFTARYLKERRKLRDEKNQGK